MYDILHPETSLITSNNQHQYHIQQLQRLSNLDQMQRDRWYHVMMNHIKWINIQQILPTLIKQTPHNIQHRINTLTSHITDLDKQLESSYDTIASLHNTLSQYINNPIIQQDIILKRARQTYYGQRQDAMIK